MKPTDHFPTTRMWVFITLSLFVLIPAIMLGCSILCSKGGVPAALDRFSSIKIVKSYHHDSNAFTQGLVFWQGSLYESTGLYGQSTLRKVDLDTGNVLQSHSLDNKFFGEGLTILNGQLYQLTWKEKQGFIYDAVDFALTGTFPYTTEGWGLTTDGENLILSDGSSNLFFYDPKSMELKRSIQVIDNNEPVESLNELEYVRGEIFANIWHSPFIVRVDPGNGSVLGWIDLSTLVTAENNANPENVLNGIAYDSKENRLFVTGKKWSALYEIQLINQSSDKITTD